MVGENNDNETSQEEGFFNQFKTLIFDYAEEKFELGKLTAIERTAKIIAVIFSLILMGTFLFFALLFVSIMAGYFFGQVFDSLFIGFGIIAIIYIIIFALILIFKDKIEKPVMNIFIRIMLHGRS